MAETSKEPSNIEERPAPPPESETTSQSDIDRYLDELNDIRSQIAMYRQQLQQPPPVHEEIKDKIRSVKDTVSLLSEEQQLFKILSQSDGDATKLFLLYMMWSDMRDKSLMRMQALQNANRDIRSEVSQALSPLYQKLSSLEAKIQALEEKIKKEEEKAREEKLLKKIEELEKKLMENQTKSKPDIYDYVDSKFNELLSKINETLPKNPVSDEIKEILSEIKESLKKQEESEVVRTLKQLEETIKSALTNSKGGSGEPLSDLDKLERLLDRLKNFYEKIYRPRVSSAPITNTQSPLNYEGSAPWWMHPDARMSLKDLIDTIFKNINDAIQIYSAYKHGAVPSQVVKKEQLAKIDEELPKI